MLILQELDEVLGGDPRRSFPANERAQRVARLKERIASAFREGRVLALQAETARGGEQHRSIEAMGGSEARFGALEGEPETPLQTQMTVLGPADPSDPWSFLEPLDQAHPDTK